MPKKSLQFYVFWLKYRFQYRGIAKLVRHQVLILASVGSSPATPAICECRAAVCTAALLYFHDICH